METDYTPTQAARFIGIRAYLVATELERWRAWAEDTGDSALAESVETVKTALTAAKAEAERVHKNNSPEL